jgi:YggT family protein
MVLLAELLTLAINIFVAIVIINVIIHWLVVFDVFNTRNPQAQNLINLLERITKPVMEPIQKYTPPIGGIDISPIVVIIGAEILKQIIWSIFG